MATDLTTTNVRLAIMGAVSLFELTGVFPIDDLGRGEPVFDATVLSLRAAR